MKLLMQGSEWFTERPGGLNRYFEDLYRALVSHGQIEVEARAFGQSPPGGTSWGKGRNLLTRTWNSRVSSSDVDIVDSHFALYGGRPRSKINVFHFHGPWFAESAHAGDSGLRTFLKRSVETSRYRGSEAAITLSQVFADMLVGELGYPASSIEVIPPGVDLEKFSPGLVSESDSARLLVVRRLEKRMGIDVLLRAVAQARKKESSLVLDIVGVGTEEGNLKALAADLDLTRHVRFHGRVSDNQLVDMYGRATCSVIPTVALEGFGLIAIESLAAGCPVIASDQGGLAEALAGLEGDPLVEPGNSAALSERLVAALRGHIPSRQTCRKHAEAFSWTTAAERHVALYSELAR